MMDLRRRKCAFLSCLKLLERDLVTDLEVVRVSLFSDGDPLVGTKTVFLCFLFLPSQLVSLPFFFALNTNTLLHFFIQHG